jgi:tRNA U34 5-carboxymethylaminomethyl modifying enzyme MnmG/GidA
MSRCRFAPMCPVNIIHMGDLIGSFLEGNVSVLQERLSKEKERLANTRVQPSSTVALETALLSKQPVSNVISLEEILRRPHVHYPCEL